MIFLSGLQVLEQRAEESIQLRGEYAEKIPRLVAVTCFFPGLAKDISAHTPRGMYGTEQLNVSCVFCRMKNLWASCW
jgi:hypothetical protein